LIGRSIAQLVSLAEKTSSEENQEASAASSKWRNIAEKISRASAFLRVVRLANLAQHSSIMVSPVPLVMV
jgi:hypothetical protein